jgi:hypothetical protein
MPRSLDDWRRSDATALPGWIKPQVTRLVDQAPDGPDWLSSWFDRPELIGATLPLRLGSPSYKRDRFEAHWEAETETWRLLLEDLTESHYIATVWPLPPMMPLVS